MQWRILRTSQPNLEVGSDPLTPRGDRNHWTRVVRLRSDVLPAERRAALLLLLHRRLHRDGVPLAHEGAAGAYADGNIDTGWKPLSFTLEIGSVNDRFSLRNASLALHEIPYAGTLRMGTFDAPMSLSWLTSSRATPMMERGMVVDALDPGMLSGLQLSNWLAPQRLTWAFEVSAQSEE